MAVEQYYEQQFYQYLWSNQLIKTYQFSRLSYWQSKKSHFGVFSHNADVNENTTEVKPSVMYFKEQFLIQGYLTSFKWFGP